MAQPTNTHDTYDAQPSGSSTNWEDVQDKIYMVTPEATPCMTNGRRFKAKNRYHEWLRDVLATPDGTNAVIEGDDRTGTAITPPTRVANHSQLMDKVAVITTSQEASNKIGRASEMKREVAKKMVELKRDVEARLVGKLPAVAGNSTTARQTGSLGVLIYTNALHNGAGATTAHTSGAPTTANTAGTNRTFTEALVKTAMQSIYTQSGDMASLIMMSPAHKATFSSFSGIAVNRYDIPKGKQAVIIGAADLYVSDFGNLSVVPNYVMAGSDVVYVLNPDTYGLAYFQPFKSEPLAKTGHTDKELVSVEAICVVTAERSNAKIDNLTP